MSEGHIADATYGGWMRSSWLNGPPQKNWLGALKVRKKDLQPITSYRCESCGFLEHYVP